MEVKNTIDEFSEEWDTLLNDIINDYISCDTTKRCTITFKIKTGKGIFFNKYTYYTVWVASKEYGYGSLHMKDGKYSPLNNKPSDKTLQRLYSLEKKLLGSIYKPYK